MNLLFGSWARRGIIAAACIMAFTLGLTGALVTAVKKAPATYMESVKKVPVVGPLAIKLAGPQEIIENKDTLDAGEDVKTYREIRPLSAEEISQLIEDLREQKRIYSEQRAEVVREQKRLSMARADLAKERQAIDALREKVSTEWEEIQKARDDLKKKVAVMESDETVNLKKLAKQYEAMKPDKAAAVLQELSENTAAKIMFLMRERAVGKILEKLDKEAVTRLSEKMALLKIDK